MGIEFETDLRDVKCIITIEGREGQVEAKINIEFDPPMRDKYKAAWENSGAGTMASHLLDKINEVR